MKIKRFVMLTVCLVLVLFAAELYTAQKPQLVVQTGHAEAVSVLAVSPDGRILASAGNGKTVKLWDFATGTELRSLIGHSFAVSSIAFSPDSKILASGSGDMTVRLWDVITGTELRRLEGHMSFVSAVAFSPNGRIVASSSEDRTIKLWEVATGRRLRTLTGYKDGVHSIAFSPSGRILASGARGGQIRLWSVVTGKQLRSFGDADDTVSNLSFTPDGKILVGMVRPFARVASTIKLWNVARGAELKILPQLQPVRSIALSPDGRTLAVAYDVEKGSIQLWDLASGQSRTLVELVGNLLCLAFSPDGRALAGARFPSNTEPPAYPIQVWDVSNGTQRRVLEGHASSITSVGFTQNGKNFTCANSRGVVAVIEAATGHKLRSQSPMGDHSWLLFNDHLTFSPDGRKVAGRTADKNVIVREVATATELAILEHSEEAGTLAFNHDSTLLAGGSKAGALSFTDGETGVVKLWDASTGKERRTFGKHYTTVTPIIFSPDSKLLVSGGENNTIEVWDADKAIKLRELKGLTLEVKAIVFSSDGKFLAAGGWDETVMLWEVETGKQLRSIKVRTGPGTEYPVDNRVRLGQSSIIEAVAFSPNGKILASGGWDNLIKLWDVGTGKELRTLKGHKNTVESISFSPDGQIVASGSQDSEVKFWQATTGEELASLIPIDEQDWAAVTPQGLFDGSPGSWGKLVWRVENNTLDFAAVEAYFNDFYYPGLLAEVFAGKRPKAPLDISQKDRRQPQLKITAADAQANPAITARTVNVKIQVSEAGADKDHKTGSGAQDLRLFRNGSLVKVWRDDVLKSQSSITLDATVPIVAGENRLVAYAFNHDNIKSSDATLVVNGADSLKRVGTLYVLGIGSNEYKSKGYDLKFAIADIEEMSRQVKSFQDKLGTYAQTEVIALENQEATKANVKLALDRFGKESHASVPGDASPSLRHELDKIKELEPEDALVIYYAGHGTAIGEHFYLLPYDFVAGNEAELKASSISDIELNDALERVDAGKLLMIIDACQSGQALGGEKEGRGPMNSKGLAQLAYDKGMYILTASQSYQAAQEVSRTQTGQKIEHGLLTFALLEGLSKAKKDNNGRISERDWMNYAVDQVPMMQTEEMKKRNLENKTRNGPGRRGTEIVFDEADKEADPEKRNVQRPRVFYRRELETHPLIVARQ